MPAKPVILKKRKDFLRVAQGGVHVVTNTLILQAALSVSENIENWRVGFTATKKIGKAYIRNRSKRRLRAAMREVFPLEAMPQTDYVLISRFNTFCCPYKNLLKDLRTAVKKINNQLKKTDDENTADLPD